MVDYIITYNLLFFRYDNSNNKENNGEKMIITNDNYWDCECKNNYIHLKKDRLVCPICKAEEDDGQPDSRVNELIEKNFYKKEKK